MSKHVNCQFLDIPSYLNASSLLKLKNYSKFVNDCMHGANTPYHRLPTHIVIGAYM